MSSVWDGAKYDFLERARKFAFLAITALAVLGAFWAVPNSKLPVTSIVIEPNHFAQASDPSWIPMAAAICAGIFLPLIGVMYCKNTLSRDKETGVLSLVQTSSTGKVPYFMGKFLSNCLTLFCILAVIAGGSLVMVLVRFPDHRLSVYSFLTPFLSLLPGLVFCASISVLLESIALRFHQAGSGIGTILFFILYLTILTFSVLGNESPFIRIFDFSGCSWLKASIDSAVYPRIGHSASFAILAGGDAVRNSPDLPALVFTGLVPSWKFLMDKVLLCCISLLTVVLAAAIMPEYEQSINAQKKVAETKRKYPDKKSNAVHVNSGMSIECKMMLRGQSRIWWIGLACLWCAAIFAPLTEAQDMVWPLLFGWSFMVFSKMGCREYGFHMADSIRSINGAFVRQCSQNWLVGFLFSMMITLPIMIRMTIAGEFIGICSGIIFSLFIPSLALFLGEYTKSSRPFEIISLVICYLMLNYPPLILGISAEYVSMPRIVLFFILSLVMLLGALGKRSVYTNGKYQW